MTHCSVSVAGKGKKDVSLGELAKAAGVSRATVSRALKDNPVISAPVRARIHKLAKKMGYRPDPEATRLMSYLKTSRNSRFKSVIGILNAFDTMQRLRESDYTAELIDGAMARAKKLGYSIDILNLGEEGMTPRRLDQIIHARGIRGVLIPPEPDPLFKTELDWSQIAAVATTTTAQPVNLNRVLPHNFHNIKILLDEIIKRGYERVGLIAWDQLELRQMSAPTAIYGLYAHVEKRIKPLEVHQWNWRETESTKEKRMAKWIRKNKPEVVLAFGEPCVRTIYNATGLEVPKDIAYVCYGDSEEGASCINQVPAQVGAAAIDMLSAHIQRGDTGLPKIPKTTLIDGHYVHNDTLPERSSLSVR